MAERVIPLADQRYASARPRVPLEPHAPTGNLLDTLGRPLRDLRISVTDRCNFRCSYCMPKEVFDKSYAFLPHASLLTFEEITRVARLFAAHGMRKVRLTGGEPLLRKNLEILVGMLRELRTVDGRPLDLTLTTNGSLLARKAQALKDAGLDRVTVSLDALDDAIFRRMNDADFPVAAVLDGIAAASAAGLGPLKVNMVVKRGTNDDQILPMARHFKGSGAVLRFIEYMDVGATNGWRMDEVLPSAEVRAPHRGPLPGRADRRQRRRRDRAALALPRRQRRVRRDLERHAGVLRRLQPRPAVDRRQAVPLPVREPRARPARAAARRLQRCADRRGDRLDLECARRPLLGAAEFVDRAGERLRAAPRRDALHRRLIR